MATQISELTSGKTITNTYDGKSYLIVSTNPIHYEELPDGEISWIVMGLPGDELRPVDLFLSQRQLDMGLFKLAEE